jgi:hypothetical protein
MIGSFFLAGYLIFFKFLRSVITYQNKVFDLEARLSILRTTLITVRVYFPPNTSVWTS